jgi:excinuclease UvrABC nuclease subunit
MAVQDLKEQIVRLPEQPGVYVWSNAAGEVLYGVTSARTA